MTASGFSAVRRTGTATQWSPAWQRYSALLPALWARKKASPQSGWQRCACVFEDWNAWQIELLLATASEGGWRPSTRSRERPELAASSSRTSTQRAGSSASGACGAARSGAWAVLSINSRGTFVGLGAAGGSARERPGDVRPEQPLTLRG